MVALAYDNKDDFGQYLASEYDRKDFEVHCIIGHAQIDLERLEQYPADILKTHESALHKIIKASQTQLRRIAEVSAPIPLRGEGGVAW